jgi:hypothetical protein
MTSLCHPVCEERESNHGELQGSPFPEGHYRGLCAVVRGVPVELAPCGLCDRDGGIRTMRREPVDMTWSEAVVAFAVMGIITFLLLV